MVNNADVDDSSQVTATWFHKRKGFAIGIVASGASICKLFDMSANGRRPVLTVS